LSEFLPFRSQAFDHVVFATSLDHIIDPARALHEALRVCRAGGEIDIWNGEKREGTPRAPANHEWYGRMERPQGAEDVFHMRRLRSSELKKLFAEVGVLLAEEQAHRIDEFRSNFFYRLRAR
jgi:ubiquinone/menaquinone biosynthesis C-methylase UbiE